jgi:heptaprenyl diphosphate synthase
MNPRTGPGRRSGADRTGFVVRVASLAAVGIALHSLEAVIPLPIPFFKVGLANAVTLLALIALGPWEAFWVFIIRLLIGSLVTGRLFGPTFILAGFGGSLAFVAMWSLLPWLDRVFSPIGLSILGALAFNVGQLLAAAFVLIGNPAVMNLMPLFLILSVIGGTITGVLVQLARPYLIDIFRW